MNSKTLLGIHTANNQMHEVSCVRMDCDRVVRPAAKRLQLAFLDLRNQASLVVRTFAS